LVYVIIFHMVNGKRFEEIKSDFITIASHQLRTPIAGIRWSLDTLLSDKAGKISDKQREIIGEAYQNNNFLVKAVNDLLRAARLEEKGVVLTPALVNIVPIIKEVIRKNKTFADAYNCRIELKLPTRPVKVYADSLQIKPVIESLVDNAIRYSKDKCLVEVSLKMVKDYLLIAVKDSGIGIPPSQQSQVFTRFFRANNAIKTQTEGLGLDLYINKKIIDASGGRITFSSIENKGTTFYVYLPLNSKVADKNKISERQQADSEAENLLKKEREFVSITIHELKAPLGATKWSLEMLRGGKSGKLNNDQLELVDQIYRGNERLLVLVRDLLDLAKLQAGEFDVNSQPLELKVILNDVVTAFKAEAQRKKIAVNLPAAEKLALKITGDSNRITQVITNLVSNAVKYTPVSGQVTIGVKKVTSEELKKIATQTRTANIRHLASRKGYLILSVKDTGVGISDEEQKKLFTRFFRGKNVLKSKTEGTGLGLYITKTIVNLHQGDIWFTSKLGKGSIFYISLPLAS